MIEAIFRGRAHLPDPETAPELFRGVLGRRALAFLLDVVIMAIVTGVLLIAGLVFSVLTLGLGALALPFIVPVVIVGYYALTLGSSMRATIGMKVFDLVLTPAAGEPLDGLKILFHPVIFWITCWFAWPISLVVAFFTPRREMVHDYLTSTLMVRRSPMVRHWRQARL
jgi:uncharacterized RDD family membrane protein YckC